jgi:transcriptional regulator with XRE-family HTH domain
MPDMDKNSELGALLQRYRRANSLTQDKLAEVVGVSTNHLARIEQGARAVTLELLQKLEEHRASTGKGDLGKLRKAYEAASEAKSRQPKPKRVSMLSLLEKFDSDLASSYDNLMVDLDARSNAPWIMFEKHIARLNASLLHPRFSDPEARVPSTHETKTARFIDKWHGFYRNLLHSEFDRFEEDGDDYRRFQRDVSDSVARIYDRIIDILSSRIPGVRAQLRCYYLNREEQDDEDQPAPSGWGAESVDELEVDEIPF